MTSQRLPGKMLREVAGRPMLQYVVDAVRAVRGLAGLVVATSSEASDDPIADYCAQQKISLCRGPLEDVAGRFLQVLDAHPNWDAFLRVTGDSPLLDPAICEQALELYRTERPDLVGNTLRRTFPKGQSVAVVSATAFRRACAAMAEPEDREHVTRYLLHRPEEFRMIGFTREPDRGTLDLSVDTEEAFQLFAVLVGSLERPPWTYRLADLLDRYDKIAPGQSGS
ncbi:MAG: acylneuraminate cytidylyltransferase [Armatimonadetes bacterium]|nr:acylneuraminate cytidylyltransferase [Armatimonadota bacterium]